MRRLALLIGCVLLAACGAGEPLEPRRSSVPVLVYRDVDAQAFAADMVRLRREGYDTITLPTFIRFLRGEPVALPPRPLLLTFDDGRADVSTVADPVLAEVGFGAVLFVDVGRVDAGEPAYLRWEQLARLQRSRRWDVQLESGSGKYRMRYGPQRHHVGPFYAFRGTDEVLGGWRERVFGDVSWGERQLAFRVPGYRPLAFSPPYGNYGQLATNDPAIPRLLLARLYESFAVVFTQDRPGLAVTGAGTSRPIGRFDMERTTIDGVLQAAAGVMAAGRRAG
jgi:peptidoglycan/xylan/chitin deacetylase (PgdA/CDA1 family)